jgi:outer membrane immunogenic protein
MKKILLSSVALLGLTAGAMAADLPVRSAPPAPFVAAVPIFTWTGFYAGVNAGYGWHENNNSAIYVAPGTFVTSPLTSGTITFGEDSGDGFVGGGQIGYNYQIGSFVLGVEADLQWADLGGSSGLAYTTFVAPPTFVAAGAAGGIDWFGTVRARVGVAFDRALVYATGGFAYGGADDDNNTFGLVNDDDVRTGWVLGAGFEYAFTNNLTAGIEGLWVNLDRGNNGGTFVGTETLPTGTVLPVYAPGNNESDNEFFVARAKLNFKFGTY